MQTNGKLLIILFLACPITAIAQARPSVCEVRPLWKGGGARSAYLGEIGRFRVEGKEGQTIRSFPYKDTTLIIMVGIDYEFDYSKPKPFPVSIRLAIIVSDQEKKEVFESVENAEAGTSYNKNWGLSVTKNRAYNDKVYSFTLSCRDEAGGRKK